MVWVCPKTGEVREGALDEPVVSVYTSPANLVTYTRVRARSNSVAGDEKFEWKWVEEADLTGEQKMKLAQWKATQK